MSNVFKYPSNSDTNYIYPDDSLLLGIYQRARQFLESDGSSNVYGAHYAGSTSASDRMAGLPNRTPEGLSGHVSHNRTYYGVTTGRGLDGYPTYESVYYAPYIYTYFHVIKFGITDAYPNATTGTLTLETVRNSTTHPNTPSFTATNTHGMGNASFKYTDYYERNFQFDGFDTSVAGEWGNYLNTNTYYVKVIDAEKLEVYTDSALTTPVNIGPSGLNWGTLPSASGICVITNFSGAYQCLVATLYDRGNERMYWYDKDYYSGAGNAVNGQFGANIVGARPSYYVDSANTSTSSFNSNPPIDYASVTDWQYNSNYNPHITIQCSGDGGVYTGSGANGCVTGVTFDVEFGGMMMGGGTGADPYSGFSQCALSVGALDSDDAPGYDFSVSNISQSNPAVVTFVNSIYDQSSGGNAANLKTFNGVGGMTQINADAFYLKQISHNSAEIYHDAALTAPVDSTGFLAYTMGGNLQDFDNNIFEASSVFGGNWDGRTSSGEYTNFGPMALDTTNAGSSDQIWPRTVSPAKMNISIIHPTRKTYGQDLTRYTNSTGAYGYRLSLTYNNITKAQWQEFDTFIKSMRGASAPFYFHYYDNDDGGGYRIFDTSQTTIDCWNAARPRLAKDFTNGETQMYLTGFKSNRTIGDNNAIVSRTGDVFFGIHTYRSNFSFNNVATASGEFQTNEFGEAIIRLTSPVKASLGTLSGGFAPSRGYTYLQCMIADDEIEYDFHPIGNTVSFKIDMDVV